MINATPDLQKAGMSPQPVFSTYLATLKLVVYSGGEEQESKCLPAKRFIVFASVHYLYKQTPPPPLPPSEWGAYFPPYTYTSKPSFHL